MQAVSFLGALDFWSVVSLFWYTIIFEIPRYTIGMVIITTTRLWTSTSLPVPANFNLSVVLAGHNEARVLRACIEGLAEQTILAERGAIEVIVVDDGSTDGMLDVARDLRREGKIDKVLRLAQRGGKSAAVNLGVSACSGDIVVISDIDTTFDRNAFAEMLGYFDDPRVGAVSGNLGVRNTYASLITRCQAIEYAISISLGRNIQDALGILSIVSGAFGVFRRDRARRSGRTRRRGRRRCRSDDEAAARRLAYSLCPRRACADRRAGDRFGTHCAAASLGSRPRHHLDAQVSRRLRSATKIVSADRCFRARRRDRVSGAACACVSRLSRMAGYKLCRPCSDHIHGDADRFDGPQPVVFPGGRGDRHANSVPASSLFSAVHDFAAHADAHGSHRRDRAGTRLPQLL